MSELRKRRDRRIKEMREKGLKPDLSKIYVSDKVVKRRGQAISCMTGTVFLAALNSSSSPAGKSSTRVSFSDSEKSGQSSQKHSPIVSLSGLKVKAAHKSSGVSISTM